MKADGYLKEFEEILCRNVEIERIMLVLKECSRTNLIFKMAGACTALKKKKVAGLCLTYRHVGL